MLLHRPPMRFGGVSRAVIGCIAFHNGSAHRIDSRLKELRTQEILISRFPGMQLDRNLALKVNTKQLVQSQNIFGSKFPGKINLGSHIILLFFCKIKLVFQRSLACTYHPSDAELLRTVRTDFRLSSV